MNDEWERTIIRRVRSGDHEAFAAIVENYGRAIYNLMFRLTGDLDTAGDMAQEAFLRAFEQLRQFDDRRRFFPWFYTVALNVARNHRSKVKRRPRSTGGDMDAIPATADPESRMQDRFAEQRLQSQIDRLAPHEKEAVVLRYYQDLPFEKIAEILEISCSAAKMRVYRALKRLRELMDGE